MIKKKLVIYIMFILMTTSTENIFAQTKSEVCSALEVSMNEGPCKYNLTIKYRDDILIVSVPIQCLALISRVSVEEYRKKMTKYNYKRNMGKSFINGLYPMKEALNNFGFYYVIYRIKDTDNSITSSKKRHIKKYKSTY